MALPSSCQPRDLEAPAVCLLVLNCQGRQAGAWAIAEGLLEQQDHVMAVEVGEDASNPDPSLAERFPFAYSHVALASLTTEAVSRALDECIDRFGSVDAVLYWCDFCFEGADLLTKLVSGEAEADAGHTSALQVRQMMDDNLGNLFVVVKATLPALRQSGAASGASKLLTLSTSLGILGAPGAEAYSSSRWACDGLVKSLSYEVHAMGVRTSIVDMGLGLDKLGAHPSLPLVVWELVHCGNPPVRIALGKQASRAVRDKLRAVVEEIEDWKHLFEV